jgi:transketolase
MRLSAIMHLPVLYVFTHDSIGLGEDGPTHQPIEQLAACRAIPNLLVMRPADANEVAEAYRVALQTQRSPIAIVLTRQDVPTLDRDRFAPASGLRRGGYILAETHPGIPEIVLMGTGSELHIALEAYERLAQQGMKVRLVSMPCGGLFDAQDAAYRDQVLPPQVRRRIAVEAGIEMGWAKYLGAEGRFVGLTGFGGSAPFEQLYEHFGLTADRVVAVAKELLATR